MSEFVTLIPEGERRKELLFATGLDIIAAGTEGDFIRSAHGKEHSVVMLRLGKEVIVWEMVGLSKQGRMAHMESLYEKIKKQFPQLAVDEDT